MGQLLWKTIEKPAVIPIGTGNHHPNCRKPGPGSGGKSTFPCHFFFKEGNDLFFSVELFYLFMAALGLYCCAQAFSGCDKQGLLSSYGALTSYCRAIVERGL